MASKSGEGSPFLDSISDYMFTRRYSRRTVRSYLYWIRYFIVANGKRHPAGMGAAEVVGFLKTNLTDLARHFHALYQDETLEALADKLDEANAAAQWLREDVQLELTGDERSWLLRSIPSVERAQLCLECPDLSQLLAAESAANPDRVPSTD